MKFLILHLLIAGVASLDMSSRDQFAEETCEELRAKGAAPIPAYSTNMRVLMDSWNNQNLLPPRMGAVWDHVDNDRNNADELTTNWIQQSNTPCQQSVQVCGFSKGPQDNWLITQLINRTVNGTRLSQVSVMIEFELQSCDVTLNCQRTFNTHVFETSFESATGARDTTNYRQVDRISPDITTGARVNETIDLNFSTNHSSFYFSIQDETACMVITRLMIFYYVCPKEITDLVIRPETIAPPITRESSPHRVTAKCVANASPVVDEITRPVVDCAERGAWYSLAELGCSCDHGYLPDKDGQKCKGCSEGQYFSTFAGTCVDCPENSFSITNSSSSLECVCMLDGYHFVPRGNDQNESCVATVMKEKSTSSPSLLITLSILLLLITLIGAVTTILLFLYKRHQINQNAAHGHNGIEQPTGDNVLQEETVAGPNGVQLRPLPLLPARQISTVSTRSYVSARSSTTSFRWNLAYFLFKVLGSPPGDTESPAAGTGPSDQTFESRDRIERDDIHDSTTSTAAHMHTVNVRPQMTETGVDSPHYVNINNYGSGEQRNDHEDRNERSTTAEFNKGEYLHVLS